MATEALLGRTSELSMLRTFCRRAGASDGSLLLTGEPGVGKTALLQALGDWAETEGWCVLRANGVRAEVGMDFSLLNQLLLPLQGCLSSLRGDDERALSGALGFVDGTSPEDRSIASAASSLLRLAAVAQRVLLVVDDLQWADRASAQVLGLLIRGLDGSGITFLGASRSPDVGLANCRMPCTEVLPLDPDAAAELIVQHFPRLDRRRIPALLTRSGGNPLALVELPQLMGNGQGRYPPPPGAALLLSRRVKTAFAADLEALPAETRRLLLLLALDIRGDVTVVDAATVNAASGMPVLRAAEQARLVSADKGTGRLTFTHPLVAFTVIGLATSHDRRVAHLELAQRLGGRPEHQALHRAEAATGPDVDLAAQVEEAAASIARDGEVAEAVTLYLRSAALSEHLASRARRLTQAAHLSVVGQGDLGLGLNLLAEARECDPAVASSLSYAMAFASAALHGSGDAEAAHRTLVNAITAHLARDGGDRGLLVEGIHALLELWLWTQRPEQESSLRALLSELHPGEGVILRLRLATLAQPLRAPVDPFEYADGALEQRLDLNHTDLVRAAECALHLDGLAPYRDRLEAVVADARRRDGTPAAVDALCCLAQDAFTTGDWHRAQDLIDQGLAWCEGMGYQLRAWTLRWTTTLIQAARGERAAVRQTTDEMLHWAETHGIQRVARYAHHARALAALGGGQFELAYQEATASTAAGGRPPCGSGTVESALCAVEAAMHTYRDDAASRQAMIVRSHSLGFASPRTTWLVAWSTAIATREEDKAPLFDRALADHSSARYPFELARAQLAYGQYLRRSRGTTVARAHLRTALDGFERLDARPWVKRARIELEATSETRSQVDPGRALTPQERTVAQLAAAGFTNKQIAEKLFLTHRTVAAHLHQVFPKLGIDSRAALRDALDTADSGPLPQGRWQSTTLMNHQGEDRGQAARQHREVMFATP